MFRSLGGLLALRDSVKPRPVLRRRLRLPDWRVVTRTITSNPVGERSVVGLHVFAQHGRVPEARSKEYGCAAVSVRLP